MYLEERNPKGDPCNDSEVGLHHTGHQCEAALHSTKIQDLEWPLEHKTEADWGSELTVVYTSVWALSGSFRVSGEHLVLSLQQLVGMPFSLKYAVPSQSV